MTAFLSEEFGRYSPAPKSIRPGIAIYAPGLTSETKEPTGVLEIGFADQQTATARAYGIQLAGFDGPLEVVQIRKAPKRRKVYYREVLVEIEPMGPLERAIRNGPFQAKFRTHGAYGPGEPDGVTSGAYLIRCLPPFGDD